MKDKIKIGIIGLGGRGMGLLKDPILAFEDVEVTALCDVYTDRIEESETAIREKRTVTDPILKTTDYHEVLNSPDVEAVIITAAWEAHTKIAVAAMKAGKYVGLEVGGAYDISQCWELVNTHEETGTHCMLLENCCYGQKELLALNMVQQGLLGEIVHCEGGYQHDLREEITFGKKNRHYRLRNYIGRNCENYPTHELGPIAKILNINRGNRMMTLVSTASKAAGLHEYISRTENAPEELKDTVFKQGDIVTTVITCAGGETIVLTLDTTLPRYYSRGLSVRGTKGMYDENTHSVFLESDHEKFHFNWRPQWGNADQYAEKYNHPIWKKGEEIKGSHDGMDFLVLRRFFDYAKENAEPPIDIYDCVSWMCITALSEESIATGQRVYIPDFTRGEWMTRKFVEL